MRLQPTRRIAHLLQIIIVHARLIENDVREVRQTVFHVLDTAIADDAARVGVVRPPERRLVDPIGFLLDPLAEAERLKHLHRPARDAIGLAELKRAVLLFDDAGADIWEGRQLGRERQAGRATPDDQHVHLLRQFLRVQQNLLRCV